MFGIGETEFAMILIFAFLLFGPDKLPGLGKTVGRALRQFREAEEGISTVVQAEIIDPMTQAARGEKDPEDADIEDDLDADVEVPEGQEPPKRETFAERKARMERERAAAAASAAPVDVASDDDLPEDEAPAPAPEPKPEPEPQRMTAASLYNLYPTPAPAAEPEPEPAAEPEPESVPAPEDPREEEGA